MQDQIILTIGRQFGSGGRIIGQKLADAFGIAYYDKELFGVAAQESGLCRDVFERADEKTTAGMSRAFWRSMSYMGGYTPQLDILSSEGLFKLQSDAIRKLATTESCVIVGRCADYILRDHPALVSFFVHSPLEERIRIVVERHDVTPAQARDLITKTDKSRAAYYDYFTNKTWGRASSYDLSINVSTLGFDGTAAFMKTFAERKLGRGADSGA